jgi:Tfp pilus assembly protein PilE
MVLGILAAIVIPQYQSYTIDAQDEAARSAYHAVARCQEEYFIATLNYTADYRELMNVAGLVLDENIKYGPISLYYDRQTQQPCFKFTARHKNPGRTVFQYDPCSMTIVTIVQ